MMDYDTSKRMGSAGKRPRRRLPRRSPTAFRGVGIGATALLLAALLAACGSDDGSAPATTNAATTSTTAASVTTTPLITTTIPVDSAGTLFGWLRSFEETDGATVVGVDEAEMLTGAAAVAAARSDGAIGADEDLPNDFYIRNPDEATVQLTVSPDVLVTLQACYPDGECVTTEQVDLDTWSVLLGGEDDPGLAWDWYGAGTLPYEFTVDNDVVVAAQEFYLP
jgi:hypothetical protein